MRLLDRLTNWLRPQPAQPLPEPTSLFGPGPKTDSAIPTYVPAQPEKASTIIGGATPMPLDAFRPAEEPEIIPDWLADEDVLRDEGVIFGLSDSRPEEKIGVIRTYFQRQTATLEREVEQHNEKIGELNLFIGEKEQRITELRQKRAQLDAQRPEGEHQLPRTLIGLVLSIAMCVGNYYLIEETLRPVFQDSRLISVGVFLAGMFSLFGRTSAFHDPDARMSVRRALEEIGLPLAAALFVFVQALQTQSVPRAIALYVFVFFLFLYAGKLLLGTLTVLRNDLRYWSASRRLEAEKRSKGEAWEAEIRQLEAEMDDLRVQKWQVIPVLNRADAERSRLIAQRDMLINLFESEYALARSLRDRLSESQRRAIRGE